MCKVHASPTEATINQSRRYLHRLYMIEMRNITCPRNRKLQNSILNTQAYLSFRFLADIGPIAFCAFHMIGHLKSGKQVHLNFRYQSLSTPESVNTHLLFPGSVDRNTGFLWGSRGIFGSSHTASALLYHIRQQDQLFIRDICFDGYIFMIL